MLNKVKRRQNVDVRAQPWVSEHGCQNVGVRAGGVRDKKKCQKGEMLKMSKCQGGVVAKCHDKFH